MIDPDDIVARLRETTVPHMEMGWPVPHVVQRTEPLWHEAADEIERLRHERDEARREVCELRTDIGFSRPMASRVAEFAASRGWDCFQ